MIRVPESLDRTRAQQLVDAILASSDPVIVLDGAQDTFCRGMDFTALVSDEAAIRSGVEAFAGVLRAIRTIGKPVVAVVAGCALGGGVGIAAAADVVIAGPRATFGLPEALFGLVPGVVMPILEARMTPQKARWLALTGHARSASEARELGLVDVVAPDDQLTIAVARAVKQLARARSSAVASLKHVDETALGRGVRETTRLLGSPDVRTAVRAFLDEEWLP